MELPCQGPQTVWTVGVTVQHENPERRRIAGKFVGTVPVLRPSGWIRSAPLIVAIEFRAFAVVDLGVNLALELREQPVFEGKIFLQGRHRRVFRELFIEVDKVPNTKVGFAVEHDNSDDKDRRDGSQNREYDRQEHFGHVPRHPPKAGCDH